MNCHFINFISENIFSDRPLIADTFFYMDAVMISNKAIKRPPAFISIVCPYALHLSWVFRMILNMYHDEITEYNRAELVHCIGHTAKVLSVLDFPKQAVMLGCMNAAERWFRTHFYEKGRVLHHENGITEVYVD
ncbi:MAG: hypothetical protein WCT23_04270 [Candidatus Neomarinimicrobiota bacterium]|jgi:hypothetical protein